MKLLVTVQISNRLAHSVGLGTSSKLLKACKGVLQLRNKADGKQKLVLSTNKEIVAFECDVDQIQRLRTKFIQEGRATIQVKQPPRDIMLQDCNSTDLQAFVDEIRTLLRRYSEAPPKNTVSKTPSTSAIKENNEEEKSGTLRKCPGRKRARSPELSKTESAKIKKTLQNIDRVIIVRNRANYPKEFPSGVEQITIIGIKLRKIDPRMLRLQWLNHLDLSENSLQNVDQLANLKCELKVLLLAKNEIMNLPDDIFYGSPFRSLKRLDLSDNKLAKIPTSVVNLLSLDDLNLNGNQLQYLPYNWMDMSSLRTIRASKNKLSFVPATILHLPLMVLDMSENSCFSSNQNDLRSSHVGYSSVPTLFETTCEVVMNLQRKKKLQTGGSLPSIVETYLRAGKYCLQCYKLVLRYKIISELVTPSTSYGRALSGCLISPGCTQWLVKKVICYECDNNRSNGRNKRAKEKTSRLYLCF